VLQGGSVATIAVVKRDTTTSVLAVVRIVSVLGMSFAIASGIFMLLGGWLLPGVLALLAFLPFFAVMRYMEKRALEEDPFRDGA
jgi:hypothetical protein